MHKHNIYWDVGQFVGFMIPWKITVHLHCVCQILVFNAINTIVTDMKGNIRIYKLPLGPSTDLETHISLAFGSDNIISISLYHDPWAVCIIYLLTGYEGIASLLSLRHWLLNEAKPRSIVRVEGTTNLLFPNTQSISILLYRKTLDS
jgi:hypothetical protein